MGRYRKIGLSVLISLALALAGWGQSEDKEIRIPYSDDNAMAAIDELGALVGMFDEPAAGEASAAKLEELVAQLGEGVELEKTATGAVVVVRQRTVRKRTREWRAGLRSWLRESFPEAAKKLDAKYGWRRWQIDDEQATRVRLTGEETWEKPVVVLVHGLDEPGLLWAAVAPALLEAGYQPLEFMYPNDQPVRDSAVAFAAALADLRRRGIKDVSIVAHSMGGLVCRDCLTSPRHMQGKARGHKQFPNVWRLITVGTPNQGSQMARLRMFLEVRDQGAQLLEGNNPVLGAFLDGNSEALGDLLPDSPYLEELNKRSLPQGVAITAIAGRASPVSVAQLRENKRKFFEFLGLSAKSDEPAKAWAQLIDGIGDGAVTLSATRLAGVADHVTVDGDHVLMVRDYLRRRDFVPPAIPIILERLGRDRAPATAETPGAQK